MPNENEEGSNTPSNEESSYVKASDIGNIVNAAVSSHLKRSLATAIEAALKPALEQIKSSIAPPPPAGDEDGDKKKGKQTPEMVAMAKRLEDMEKALAAEKEATAAAQKKAREQRAFSDLRTALEGKVRPELLDVVAHHLFTVEKRVDFDESGTPLFKSTRSLYQGAEPEDVLLPLRDGVEGFLKGDTAKAFLPAPSPGAGSSPLPKRGPTPPQSFNPSQTGTTDAERVRRSMEREQAAKAKLGNQ